MLGKSKPEGIQNQDTDKKLNKIISTTVWNELLKNSSTIVQKLIL